MEERPEPGGWTIRRDGTSQADRVLAALDPAYVAVDERSPRALLAFAAAYARELRYQAGPDAPVLDWTPFLAGQPTEPGERPEPDLDELVSFLEHPERFDPTASPHLYRPHLVLFLVFVKLLGRGQAALNTFTARHLDLYYRFLLELEPRLALPDRIDVLLRPAPDVDAVRVPRGTRLSAGRDRRYLTDRDVVVNHAEVAELRSVLVERRVVTPEVARYENQDNATRRLLRMLELALGEPRPGDPLPDYDSGEPRERIRDPVLELVPFEALIGRVRQLLWAPREQLHLSYDDVRDLVGLLARRRARSAADWAVIDAILASGAGRQRREWPADRGGLTFDDRFAAAFGRISFDGLPNVENLDELYRAAFGPDSLDPDARRFIANDFSLDGPDSAGGPESERVEDFRTLMDTKRRTDNDWGQIDAILTRAGGDAGRSFVPRPATEARLAGFEADLAVAAGEIAEPELSVGGQGATSVERIHHALLRLEAYSAMSAEQLSFVITVHEDDELDSPRFGPVDQVLDQARKRREVARRVGRLEAVGRAHGFAALVRAALGEDPLTGPSQPLSRLEPYVAGEDDRRHLAAVEQQEAEGRNGQGSDVDWGEVALIVEAAQRNLEQRPEPTAQLDDWLDLHPTVHPPGAATGERGGWPAFGQPGPAATGPAGDAGTNIGWAVSSPVLALTEGARRIELTLSFTPFAPPLDELIGRLSFQLSTATGWLDVQPQPVPGGAEGTVGLRLDLDPDVEAVVPPPGGTSTSPWPMLRATLRPGWDQVAHPDRSRLGSLDQVSLVGVAIAVDVGAGGDVGSEQQGLTSLLVRGDGGVVDPTRPFEPFGPRPSVGARLAVGHPELSHKPLDHLELRVRWADLPAGDGSDQDRLARHHRNYPSQDPPAVALRAHDQAATFDLGSVTLFSAERRGGNTLPCRQDRLARLPGRAIAPDPAGRIDDPTLLVRHFTAELTPRDLQHLAYPGLAARMALELTALVSGTLSTGTERSTVDDFTLNPPYTPKIRELSIAYRASVALATDQPAGQPGGPPVLVRLHHVHPFGVADMAPGAPLLPTYPNEGELYIGLTGLRPPQPLSLLFQVVQGSASSGVEPEGVEWSYLDGGRWVGLSRGGVVHDSTCQLTTSGIVELALPAAEPGGLLPADRYWIRFSVARGAAGIGRVVAVRPQAVSAVFADGGHGADHYERPLAPGTVSRLVEAVPGLAGVEQPFPSVGGRGPEQERGFATRVSERLRHKQRAVTPWDYEHLVLDQFPEIHRAKCVPAAAGEPGVVDVVVIPDIRGQVPADPFAPRVRADLLAEIQAFLADRATVGVTVRVRNAHFVPVLVRVGVSFRPGVDPGFHLSLLNGELNRHLSPWAFDEGADIVFGGRIHATSILELIDRRPYVDWAGHIRFFPGAGGRVEATAAPGGGAAGGAVARAVVADRPDAVLVGSPRHQIDLITSTIYEPERFSGINYMVVELDFQVGD